MRVSVGHEINSSLPQLCLSRSNTYEQRSQQRKWSTLKDVFYWSKWQPFSLSTSFPSSRAFWSVAPRKGHGNSEKNPMSSNSYTSFTVAWVGFSLIRKSGCGRWKMLEKGSYTAHIELTWWLFPLSPVLNLASFLDFFKQKGQVQVAQLKILLSDLFFLGLSSWPVLLFVSPIS